MVSMIGSYQYCCYYFILPTPCSGVPWAVIVVSVLLEELCTIVKLLGKSVLGTKSLPELFFIALFGEVTIDDHFYNWFCFEASTKNDFE